MIVKQINLCAGGTIGVQKIWWGKVRCGGTHEDSLGGCKRVEFMRNTWYYKRGCEDAGFSSQISARPVFPHGINIPIFKVSEFS